LIKYRNAYEDIGFLAEKKSHNLYDFVTFILHSTITALPSVKS